MEEGQRRVVLEVTVMCAGRSAAWQAQIRVRGDPDSLTFGSPHALAEYLRQVGERPVSTQGLR